jgi:hypothetical protein
LPQKEQQMKPETPVYDELLIGGLAQMQWTWPLEMFNTGLDDLLNWVFPVTPGWVQPAYDRIMGWVDKIKSWFSANVAMGYEYQDEDEFIADFEDAIAYAERETGDTRAEIIALIDAGPSPLVAGEPG